VIQNTKLWSDFVYRRNSTLPPWAIGPQAVMTASLSSGKERGMQEMIETVLALLRIDRRGVTAVEYAIIAGVVALVIVAAFKTLGSNISSEISSVAASA
jgi:pilus assembly protein Flp/PilA